MTSVVRAGSNHRSAAFQAGQSAWTRVNHRVWKVLLRRAEAFWGYSGLRTMSPHATCAYSWMRPPSRSRRSTRISCRLRAGGRFRRADCPQRPVRVVVIDVLPED